MKRKKCIEKKLKNRNNIDFFKDLKKTQLNLMKTVIKIDLYQAGVACNMDLFYESFTRYILL